MRRRLIYFLILLLAFLLCSCSKKQNNLDEITKADDTGFMTECGINLTPEQYDNLSLMFDEGMIYYLDKSMIESAKDDRSITGLFDYEIDDKLFEKVMEKNESEKKETDKDIVRDEAIDIAKKNVDLEYDTIRIYNDRIQEMWRTQFYIYEDKEKNPDDYLSQYVYVDYSGNYIGKANVTADMELQTYSANTGKPYFTNVNGAEFTEKEYMNLMYTHSERDIIFMEKEEADRLKTDRDAYILFSYDDDTKNYKGILNSVDISEEKAKSLSRDEIIDVAREYVKEYENIPTSYLKIYYDEQVKIWKVQFSDEAISKNIELINLVYLDECGNVFMDKLD